MSDPSTKREPSERQLMLSALGVLGAILIFFLILLIAYLPNRPQPVDQALIDQRVETLATIEAQQHSATTTYGWVDQTKGVVRIPVMRAVELTVQELSASSAKAPQPLDGETTGKKGDSKPWNGRDT